MNFIHKISKRLNNDDYIQKKIIGIKQIKNN